VQTDQLAVAAFTDSDGNISLSNFTGTIDWGDGQTSQAVFKGFDPVIGSPPFSSVGQPTLCGRRNLCDPRHDPGSDGDSYRSATRPYDWPAGGGYRPRCSPFSPAGVPQRGGGGFPDSDGSLIASNFTATIDWGDGHRPAANIQCSPARGRPHALFPGVRRPHLWAAGTYSIHVAIHDRTAIRPDANTATVAPPFVLY